LRLDALRRPGMRRIKMDERSPDGLLRNSDVDWDQWPVEDYLAEIYRELHVSDAAVIDHHSEFYRRFAPQSLAHTLEIGAGPNLYPLMLAAAASQRIHALDYSASNVAYLERQLTDGADESWIPFYTRCRTLNPDLPQTLTDALSRVYVTQGDGLLMPAGVYDLASMSFVAEGCSEDTAEFTGFCQAFINSVRIGGYLVAAFVEGLQRFRFEEDGAQWPAYPVNEATLRQVFAPSTEGLTLTRIDKDPADLSFEYTGMLLLTARRAA
jgi:hypothetical protein